jgi:hypothetical protein
MYSIIEPFFPFFGVPSGCAESCVIPIPKKRHNNKKVLVFIDLII